MRSMVGAAGIPSPQAEGDVNGRRVRLPWPERRLSPNARVHWATLASCRSQAKAAAHRACKLWNLERPPSGTDAIEVSITFCPPDRRPRDLDNLLASIKAHLDGVAEYLSVDDSKWAIRLSRGAPAKGGCVDIEWCEVVE